MGRLLRVLLLIGFVSAASCGGGGGGGDDGEDDASGANREVVVFAWNDLGMHCLNSSYDTDVILPPYNTLWVQVVRRAARPEIVTSGVTVHYEMVGNTFSYGKRAFGGFWDQMEGLFGVAAAHDVGLTGNGLSGTLVLQGDHYEAVGVPVTPVDDAGSWNPYQVAKITVKDAQGAVLAETQCTVPTSDEFHCGRCHRSAAAPGAPEDPYLELHDREHQGKYPAPGRALATRTGGFLCASAGCHTTPALGQVQATHGGSYLSEAIHGFHGRLPVAEQPACYDCHPGASTRCSRSLRHTAGDGGCTTAGCHGTLAQVGASVEAGRMPWGSEPGCATCHGGLTIPEVDTGPDLYRNSTGHGGMRCPSCHGSPHAMYPASEELDKTANYQVKQYLGASRKITTIGSCGACHGTSKGRGLGEFSGAHGGSSPEARTGCHVCHTSVEVSPTQWPHQYQWSAR